MDSFFNKNILLDYFLTNELHYRSRSNQMTNQSKRPHKYKILIKNDSTMFKTMNWLISETVSKQFTKNKLSFFFFDDDNSNGGSSSMHV